MIAQDFFRQRVLATESIAELWLREHVHAGGKKTSEDASSAVWDRLGTDKLCVAHLQY